MARSVKRTLTTGPTPTWSVLDDDAKANVFNVLDESSKGLASTGLGPEFVDLVVEYRDALEADRASTLRYNQARGALIDYLKANGLEKLFHL
jgi:hypothetical protein